MYVYVCMCVPIEIFLYNGYIRTYVYLSTDRYDTSTPKYAGVCVCVCVALAW